MCHFLLIFNLCSMIHFIQDHQYALPLDYLDVSGTAVNSSKISQLLDDIEERDRLYRNATARKMRAKITCSAYMNQLSKQNLMSTELAMQLEIYSGLYYLDCLLLPDCSSLPILYCSVYSITSLLSLPKWLLTILIVTVTVNYLEIFRFLKILYVKLFNNRL